MKKQNIGLIGLGVMGAKFNFKYGGVKVIQWLYLTEPAKTKQKILPRSAKVKISYPTYSEEEFVNSLECPRKMILSVKQGKPVDDFIA